MNSNSGKNLLPTSRNKGFILGGGWVGASIFLLLSVAGIAYLFHRQGEPDDDFDNCLKEYTRRIERLTIERDSLYRVLSLRERQYRDTADSLQAAMIKIQTAQTQNRTLYENRRDSIILISDDELYRMVTSYIERYGSRIER